MPRIRTTAETPRKIGSPLVDRLADELQSERESGQPIVSELAFSSGKLRVTVIWDHWGRMPLEDRTEIILQAYEKAEGIDYRRNIALASGLTMPEACMAGMLPYHILTAIRNTDPVTVEQCREAMIAEGASTLIDPNGPQLRFGTMEEADRAVKRLVERLPDSKDVWIVAQDLGKVGNWEEQYA